jgi:hypothetical protein
MKERGVERNINFIYRETACRRRYGKEQSTGDGTLNPSCLVPSLARRVRWIYPDMVERECSIAGPGLGSLLLLFFVLFL